MKLITYLSLLLTIVCIANQAVAADGPPRRDLEIDVGIGSLYTPAFLGSKDYQLIAVPNINIKYKDQFFASVQDGVGYNIIQTNSWRLGPVAKYAFPRDDNGKNPFRVAGPISNALVGLGDVSGTYELGGFAEYSYKEWSAKLEVRQGLNGHKGLVSDIGASYTKDIHTVFYIAGPPLILSIGPELKLVSNKYNETYFGINAVQAANSDLAQYKAHGGLLSYGLNSAAILPLTQNISSILIAGYQRLASGAANSPLVKQRGSKNQLDVGLFISYAFGY